MRLREIRLEKGLSLGQVSCRTGIDKALLWRYERGLCRPRYANEKKLARVLGIGLINLRRAINETIESQVTEYEQ